MLALLGGSSASPAPLYRMDSAAQTGDAVSASLTQAPDRAVLTENCDYRVISLTPAAQGRRKTPELPLPIATGFLGLPRRVSVVAFMISKVLLALNCV